MYIKFNEYEKNMLQHIIQYGEEEDRERTFTCYITNPNYFVFMQKYNKNFLSQINTFYNKSTQNYIEIIK